MTEYSANQGDCILSIAARYGMSWQKLWDDPANASLRALRKDPSTIYPGDVVRIPDAQIRADSGATGSAHRFVKKRNLAKFKLRILTNDKPRAHEPFQLRGDQVSATGQTDAQGCVQAEIPTEAKEAMLTVGGPGEELVLLIEFGSLDPMDTDSGVKQRLAMLGMRKASSFDKTVRSYQRLRDLPQTGQIDAATSARLRTEFGQ